MFSNRTSRSASLGSIHSLVEEDILPPADMVGEDVPNTDRIDDANFKFTASHPLGNILLKMVQDQLNIARRTNCKDMETNVNDLCSAFHSAIRTERANVNNKVRDTVSQVEENLMNKELNSHSINASVIPPKYYNPTPVITSPQKLTEIMRIFPKAARFSGNMQRDGQMSVVEFLNTLTAAQNQCNLSEPEFIDRILAATTGLAHDLVFDWKINGDSASTIYHSLVVNFDNRMSADEARTRLQNFTVSKNSTLAKAESTIQLLVARASTLLPPGDSRKAYKDMEGCMALIRALPPYSSLTANNMYQSYTTRLQRACTMQELFRGLDQFRGVIDKDIKTNGAQPMGGYKRIAQKSSTGNYSSFNTFLNTTDRGKDNIGDRYRRTIPPPPLMARARQDEVSYTPRPQVRRFGAQIRPQRPLNQNRGSNSNLPRNSRANFDKKSCSLCGKNHDATECRNIRDDKGKTLDILPTYGTCGKCPEYVKPRLHHPEAVCPYRVGGTFNSKRN